MYSDIIVMFLCFVSYVTDIASVTKDIQKCYWDWFGDEYRPVAPKTLMTLQNCVTLMRASFHKLA